MKRKNTQNIGVAVLTATLQSSTDGWYQLLPAGEFSARDGRPHDVARGCWFIDADIAATFIAATVAVGQPVLCDYNHATLREQDPTIAPPSDETKWRAEAAGWLTDPATQMQWREGLGLFVRPVWTDDAAAAIDAKKWAFLSAVFPYDLETGAPLYLRMFALTNDPGLTGMQALAALAATSFIDSPTQPPTQDETAMNELLRLILVALGVIPADDTTEYTEEQLKELVATASETINTLKTASNAAVDAAAAIDAAATPEAAVEGAEQALDDTAALKEAEEIIAEAKLHNIDLAVAVPRSQYNRMVQRLTAEQQGTATLSAENIIAKARASGRVIASEVPDLLALAKTCGVAALNANIAARKPIAALAARQTTTVPKPNKNPSGVAVLSAEDRAVIKATGITEAQFLANKTALMKG